MGSKGIQASLLGKSDGGGGSRPDRKPGLPRLLARRDKKGEVQGNTALRSSGVGSWDETLRLREKKSYETRKEAKVRSLNRSERGVPFFPWIEKKVVQWFTPREKKKQKTAKRDHSFS